MRKPVFRFFSRGGPPKPPHLSLGRRGEKLAAGYLRKQHYKVLYRNFRARSGGEIDLVCRDRSTDTLVFVEVKTRSTDVFGPPRDAVQRRKRQNLIRAAMEWLRLLDHPDIPYRFDVLEIVLFPVLNFHLIRNAFNSPEDIYDDRAWRRSTI